MAGKPLIVLAVGARGTGKSAWVQREIKRTKPPRLAVWDLMDEHAWAGPGTSDLAAAITAMKAKRFAVRFIPSADDKTRAAQFDLWCRACLAAGRLVAYVEELAFVTTAAKAPPGWRQMCLLGRHERHRLTIYGTSQRPAQVDKEVFGNVDVMHCGRLASRPDADRCAGLLGVRPEELQRLPDLAWIERASGDLEARRGQLSFAAAPAPKQAPLGRKSKGEKVTRET